MFHNAGWDSGWRDMLGLVRRSGCAFALCDTLLLSLLPLTKEEQRHANALAAWANNFLENRLLENRLPIKPPSRHIEDAEAAWTAEKTKSKENTAVDNIIASHDRR